MFSYIDKIRPKLNEPTKRQQIIQRISGDTYDGVPPNYIFGTRGLRQKVKTNIKQSKANATKSHIHLKSAQISQNSRADTFSCQEEILRFLKHFSTIYDHYFSSTSSEEVNSDLEDISHSSSCNQTIQIVSSSSSIEIINIKSKFIGHNIVANYRL